MSDAWPRLAFNPQPRIEAVPIGPHRTAWVIDDALLDPRAWVEFAAAQRPHFAEATHNAYPGPELRLPDDVVVPLATFFALHLRERLGARRVQRMYARLAMTTLAPAALSPRQRLCHVDRLDVRAGERLGATVLYLFDDATLGGTSFYRPIRPVDDIATLLRDSATLDNVAFDTRYGFAPGYMLDGTAWFERTATIPARFNRLVAFDGGVFHSGDIRAPDRLVDDAHRGRLCLNGFFSCTRPLAV